MAEMRMGLLSGKLWLKIILIFSLGLSLRSFATSSSPPFEGFQKKYLYVRGRKASFAIILCSDFLSPELKNSQRDLMKKISHGSFQIEISKKDNLSELFLKGAIEEHNEDDASDSILEEVKKISDGVSELGIFFHQPAAEYLTITDNPYYADCVKFLRCQDGMEVLRKERFKKILNLAGGRDISSSCKYKAYLNSEDICILHTDASPPDDRDLPQNIEVRFLDNNDEFTSLETKFDAVFGNNVMCFCKDSHVSCGGVFIGTKSLINFFDKVSSLLSEEGFAIFNFSHLLCIEYHRAVLINHYREDAKREYQHIVEKILLILSYMNKTRAGFRFVAIMGEQTLSYIIIHPYTGSR